MGNRPAYSTTLFCYRRADNVEWLQRQGGASRVFPPHSQVNILLV